MAIKISGVNVVDNSRNFSGAAATFTGNVSIAGTLTYDDVTNIDSVGLITARSGVIVTSGGIDATGIVTAKSGVVVTSGGIDVTGIVTASGGFNIGISSAGTTITSGPITELNFIGAGNTFAVDGTTVDISIAGGGGGGGGGSGLGQFNVGITSILSASVLGIGSTVLTLPSTAGLKYIIHSINVSNVAAGNTESNIIGAIDFDGGGRSYFAYNVPIPTGTSIELFRKPQVLNPSDSILLRSTDYDRNGVDNIIEAYISYETQTDDNYFGVGVGTVGIAVTTPVGVFTSTTYPSVLESIRLTNKTDSGAKPVSVTITSGVTTTYLIDNLTVPKYGTVELLDTPKAIKTNDVISVTVAEASTIAVQVSGIKVSS